MTDFVGADPASRRTTDSVTDKQLGRLNEVGIAQNYNMTGESSTHHSSGRVN
ncbi:hypothetical protein [Arthrobacter sp. S39]|uniref:hypothetical protein n=1 Tax=Arthrobacter sp. S39 TaxID=2509720 RepID=UPI0013EF6424|nr:hypothetical protein [Arthrobacter sp. S39]